MSALLERVTYAGLLALVLLSPLPIGSYRPWSWSLTAAVSGLLAFAWLLSRLGPRAEINTRVPKTPVLLFVLAWLWAMLQTVSWTPGGWHHPLWAMTGEALQTPIPGSVTLAPADGWTALMRLVSYALVFALALQFGRERRRAQAVFGWLALAGLVYGVFGLVSYWGSFELQWLFGGRDLPADLRSTFVNRNHFATWQGLTIVCAIAWLYQRVARPEVKPYSVPGDRADRVEAFVLRTWLPLSAVLLMTAALILTHSRGGFLASLAAVTGLVLLLDRRSGASRTSPRVLVLVALAVTGLAFYLTSEVLLDRINRTEITSEERLGTFASVSGAIGDNPFLGFGYGSFADSYRLYDQNESLTHFYHAHNTWLENAFELGLPAALCLYAALVGLALTCLRGVRRRHRDWAFPAAGVAASILVGIHAAFDFSLQLPAVAMLYALVMGVACAQSYSSVSNQA